uniref:Uncharacterized protein n=1 Tax=Romanomermis culicivorax TaxID=13658 RepID=A0A915KXX5_ROMCU
MKQQRIVQQENQAELEKVPNASRNFQDASQKSQHLDDTERKNAFWPEYAHGLKSSRKNCDRKCMKMKLVYFPLISQFIIGATEVHSVTCYCTENHCNLGICDGGICIVGIKPKGLVSRRCGENQDQKQQEHENDNDDQDGNKCVQNTQDWSEVCYCSTSYCNTLKFLLDGMQEIKTSKTSNNDQQQHQSVGFGSSSNLDLKGMQTLLGKPYKLTDDYHDSLVDFSSPNLKNGYPAPAINSVGDQNRLESDFYDEFLTGEGERKGDVNDNSAITITRQQPKLPKKNARHLTNDRKDYSLITLVIVSLVIIATAITLVTLNYYCKLC